MKVSGPFLDYPIGYEVKRPESDSDATPYSLSSDGPRLPQRFSSF
jgi:hypothetical protein